MGGRVLRMHSPECSGDCIVLNLSIIDNHTKTSNFIFTPCPGIRNLVRGVPFQGEDTRSLYDVLETLIFHQCKLSPFDVDFQQIDITFRKIFIPVYNGHGKS